MTSSVARGGGPTSEHVAHTGSESVIREGCAVQTLEPRWSWIDRAIAVIRRGRQQGVTKFRCRETSAVAAVIGRCVLAPLLLVFIFGATGYLSTAKFFIGPEDSYFAYSQLDSVMHGGCSGCVCSCRKVLIQLSAFGSDAIMSKPAYEDLQAMATEAEAAGDYSRLTPEALALADQLDANGAVCSTGMNDWGTPNIVLSDEPEGVLKVITTLRLSVSPQMLRELQVAVERKEKCISRWNIGILLRLFKFQNVKNSLDYSSVPVADINTFPHYTDCRPDIPNEGIVGEKLAMETNGEDVLVVVPDILKLFPYQFSTSLPKISRYIPAKDTIYGANNVTQPLFKGYYAGCRVRVVNVTGVYVEDTCTLLKHWRSYGLMLQTPDDLPVCSTGDVCIHNQYNSQWEYTNDVNPTDSTRLDQFLSVFRSRYADTVDLSVLPGVVVIQILFMGIVSLYQVMSHHRSVLLTQIWAYRCQNGRMQPIYLAQITYHLAFNSNLYYLGLSTGTLSMASVLNLTLSFFAFNYSFINLIRARSGDQVLDRHFRIPWEILQLTSMICTFAVLSSLRLTSLAFIGEFNGELLRRTSARGARYCGLKDSCYVFTVNLVFVVAGISFAMGFVASIGGRREKQARGTSTSPRPSSWLRVFSSKKVGPTVLNLQQQKLTTFEENCLGGQFIRLFYDCEDFAYTTFRGKRCTSVEAILLTGYLFYGQHLYQATSVLMLLVARVLPRKVIRTFNVLLIRWRIDPNEGALSHALSCTWYNASAERFKISEAIPVA
ncbi:hypothetical protein PPTG_12470 [Phytophthora nicotianae INRA-310]|uniref:Uncharacterized protein n=1 Tax=Phytophthora nicotianae (strain INRA-310) TaxID=761204 RepID=W2Q6R7_PHYN3|nr:hypothetical protein PPTG_12470 [Phytophthora nicotianae INRA-310]ETN07950.1 hypothetical protein PPTG_12470 [Phytophthora nicotianae INRA-310]